MMEKAADIPAFTSWFWGPPKCSYQSYSAAESSLIQCEYYISKDDTPSSQNNLESRVWLVIQ
jgi:hypothetical protein